MENERNQFPNVKKIWNQNGLSKVVLPQTPKILIGSLLSGNCVKEQSLLHQGLLISLKLGRPAMIFWCYHSVEVQTIKSLLRHSAHFPRAQSLTRATRPRELSCTPKVT